MSLPYNPTKDIGVVLGTPFDVRGAEPENVPHSQCARCKIRLLLSPEALDLAQREELPIMCLPDATQYIAEGL